MLRLYEGGLVVTAAALVVALVRRAVDELDVDRVIELGETESVRGALARLLADPSLEIGFRRDSQFVDEKGVTLELPPASERRTTALAPEDGIIVLHDPAIVLGPGLVRAISRSLRLTSEHARLTAETADRVAQLRASRRRLAHARERQRALLARRLDEGVERRLLAVAAALQDAKPESDATAAAVARVQLRLEAARQTLESLALGLQPAPLAAEGLAGALYALVDRSPVPIALDVDERRFDAAVEHAAWLVCSEALANVTKHARATTVAIRVSVEGDALALEVRDDGVGGARLEGSGLSGLAARVEELGGELRLDSPPAGGTRVRAELPLGRTSEVEHAGRDLVVRGAR